MMRGSRIIGIDAHMVGSHETGNETYIVGLAEGLIALGGYRYRIYTPRPAAFPGHSQLRKDLLRVIPDVPAVARLGWLYPALARQDKLDILHMSYVAPPRSPCPIVLSVHDVSYRIFPGFFSPRVRFIIGALVGPSMRRASRVIVPSQATRRDIVRFYRIPSDRVSVIPLAATSDYVPQPADVVARVVRKYGLSGRYMLAVGNVQPRKNLARLVEAFGAIADTHPDVQLVIVGQSAWKASQVGEVVACFGLAERVRFTGYAPRDDLPGLYSGATAFCYPSLYEGFGLPVLEAMACGAPTITSNVSSLPEVAGAAAILVDPTSISELSNALQRLLSDEEARRQYAELGLARAGQFSWSRTAQLTRHVYDEILRHNEL